MSVNGACDLLFGGREATSEALAPQLTPSAAEDGDFRTLEKKSAEHQGGCPADPVVALIRQIA